MKRGRAKAARKPPSARKKAPARPLLPPPPEPYAPNWGEVDPEAAETLLEWVDLIEID
ncbi:MAG: hypothetical protein QXO51_07250 [Halobacteria archaeon]